MYLDFEGKTILAFKYTDMVGNTSLEMFLTEPHQSTLV